MPIYEYECPDCKRRFEKIQRVYDHTSEVDCDCGGKAKTIIASNQFVQTWEPFFHKTARRSFETKKQFDRYCKNNNFSRPTAREIKQIRERYTNK